MMQRKGGGEGAHHNHVHRLHVGTPPLPFATIRYFLPTTPRSSATLAIPTPAPQPSAASSLTRTRRSTSGVVHRKHARRRSDHVYPCHTARSTAYTAVPVLPILPPAPPRTVLPVTSCAALPVLPAQAAVRSKGRGARTLESPCERQMPELARICLCLLRLLVLGDALLEDACPTVCCCYCQCQTGDWQA